jgi:hypothetical protein
LFRGWFWRLDQPRAAVVERTAFLQFWNSRDPCALAAFRQQVDEKAKRLRRVFRLAFDFGDPIAGFLR